VSPPEKQTAVEANVIKTANMIDLIMLFTPLQLTQNPESTYD
jgi:hypothetical protein